MKISHTNHRFLADQVEKDVIGMAFLARHAGSAAEPRFSAGWKVGIGLLLLALALLTVLCCFRLMGGSGQDSPGGTLVEGTGAEAMSVAEAPWTSGAVLAPEWLPVSEATL